MVTGKEDLLMVLSEAFLMEKGTKIFYEEAAAKSVTPEARSAFTFLSEWEGKDMDFILFLYRSIHGDNDIITYENFKNKAKTTVTESGISIEGLETTLERYLITDEMHALTLAMEIEGKAYTLYRKLSERAEDTNAQVVFKEMMEQEVSHITYLKDLRVKLADVYKP